MVKASGNAKQDQSLYIGTYNKISNYNGHHAYEREGKERLYIYFYSSLVRPRQDFLLYRAEKKSLQILLSSTQAGPGRKVKQEKEEISRNHVPRLISIDFGLRTLTMNSRQG